MNAQGYVLYQGPSRINGDQIVCIASGFLNASSNEKTGPMIQTNILLAEEPPYKALVTGRDVAMCGGCGLRPQSRDADRFYDKTCYVNVTYDGQAAIWRAWQRGSYPNLKDYEVFRHRRVRFGSYGDPAAVPLNFWSNIAQVAKGWTGYTHQWRSARLRDVTAYCMASCETDEDEALALSYGLSPYRIVQADQPPLDPTAQRCVFLDDATQCYDCLACNGQGGSTIYTIAHGTRGKYIDTGAPEVVAC